MIDFNLINKKKILGKQRVEKFSSSMKKAILQTINTDFIASNNDIYFSVVDVHMSKDLKYCDIFIVFFDKENKEKNNKTLEKLNKSDGHEGFKCGFLPLKLAISKTISSKIRLKYMPEVRFKKVSDDYFLINNLIVDNNINYE
jgi:ribosome-binding factor A